MVQAAALDASAAFGRRSLAARQRKVFEAVQVLVASSQDVEACYFAVVYGFVEVGIGFVGTEEAENHRIDHFGKSEVHSGIEVEARFGTAGDHFEIGLAAHSEKKVVHFGTVEDRSETEADRSGTEEVVHSETEVGSRARLVGGIVGAAQIPDLEADQNPAVVVETGIAVVEKAVVAECTVEGRQNRTSLKVHCQMAFAVAAAEEESPASQPCHTSQHISVEQGCRVTHIVARTLTQAWTLIALRQATGRIVPTTNPNCLFCRLLCLVFCQALLQIGWRLKLGFLGCTSYPCGSKVACHSSALSFSLGKLL